MDEILLSVIIPVYNCEKKLKKCIESVISQSYSNIEIVLVNDGSTDDSKKICEFYTTIDKRLRLFTIKNVGAYQARKYGAQQATGELITFLDADDYIDLCTYERLMDIYKSDYPDVISYTFQIDDEGIPCENHFECGLYDRNAIRNKIIPNMLFNIKNGYRDLNPSVGCKIFKRQLFFKITSDVEERITWGDDALVTYPMMCIADKIYIDTHPYYHYVMNEQSSTHTFRYEIVDDLIRFRNELFKLLNKYYKEFDWKFQIDSYMRTYAEMLFTSWFGIHRTASMYVFPYHLIPYNCNVKIYGAGEVGKAYAIEMLQSKYAQFVGWYDKKKQGYSYYGIPILAPSQIMNQEVEYIIIAIDDKKVVSEIRQELVRQGISAEKIKWDKPVLRA